MDTNKKAKVAKMSTFAGSQKNHLLQLAKNRNLSLLEEESQYNASTTTRISMNSLHLDPIDDQRSSEFRSSFNSQEHSNRRFFKEDWETEEKVEPVKETFLSKIHTEIWNFAESQYFDNAMMAVIVLNAIVMTVDTQRFF